MPSSMARLNWLEVQGFRAFGKDVQRVDLPDQMTLAESADRGIAGHRPDRGKAMGDQRRAGPHPCGSARGLAAGVTSADDDDVE